MRSAQSILREARAQVKYYSPEFKFLNRAIDYIDAAMEKEKLVDAHAILRQSDSLWHRIVERIKH